MIWPYCVMILIHCSFICTISLLEIQCTDGKITELHSLLQCYLDVAIYPRTLWRPVLVTLNTTTLFQVCYLGGDGQTRFMIKQDEIRR